MKRLFALLLLSTALSACDSSTADNAANNNSRTAGNQTAATPAATPATTPESTAATASQFKAGDKVKVKIEGKPADATVVSIDSKTNHATVKLAGGAEKTVPVSDVSKP